MLKQNLCGVWVAELLRLGCRSLENVKGAGKGVVEELEEELMQNSPDACRLFNATTKLCGGGE